MARISDVRSPSVTEAFAAAIDQLPRRWPRTHWLRAVDSDLRVQFVNGDFALTFDREATVWQLTSADEAHVLRRRLWWIPALLAVALFVVGVVIERRGWWGLAAAVPLVMAAVAWRWSRNLRLGGTRVPIEEPD